MILYIYKTNCNNIIMNIHYSPFVFHRKYDSLLAAITVNNMNVSEQNQIKSILWPLETMISSNHYTVSMGQKNFTYFDNTQRSPRDFLCYRRCVWIHKLSPSCDVFLNRSLQRQDDRKKYYSCF